MSEVTYTEVKPFKEGLKEAGRTILLGIFSYLITEGVINNVLMIIFSEKLGQQTIALMSGLLLSVLRGIDKDLHLTGKIEGNDTLTRGITQF